MSCPDCFSGAAWEEEPVGTEENIHGVRTYVSRNSSPEQPPSATIIFITDAFGFNLANSKLLADMYARQTGFRVLVPDIIPGGGVPRDSLQLMNSAREPVPWWDIFGHLKRIVTILRMMSIFIPFMLRTKSVFPSVLAYARDVKAGLPSGTKLGAAGFCWGALQTTKMCAEASTEGGSAALIDAHFAAHPSGLKVPGDFVAAAGKFHVPFSIAEGDEDMIISKNQVIELEAALRREYAADESRVQVTIYEGCGHGFAVRADPTKTTENEAAGKAASQAVEWFKAFLV